MRKSAVGLTSLALATALGSSAGLPTSQASTPSPAIKTVVAPGADEAVPSDALSGPFTKKDAALRQEALTALVNGTGTIQQRGPSTVMKVSQTTSPRTVNANGKTKAPATKKSQYVELSRESTDRIFVILADFGNERHPDYPDQDTDPATPGPQVFDGPPNNAIPEPDRSQDNSTVWQPNYNRAHYQDLYFGEGDKPGSGKDVESVREYYERQSSGRYSIDGTVTDWVKVKYNEARYGRSNGFPCATNVCSNTWKLVQDAANQWVKDQRAAGRTNAEIKRELKTFDQWDRNDYDQDGDFNESDGYIDHFQIVHAGGDQADGDPYQAEDAVWSHRWYVQTTPFGAGGPADAQFGGTQVGNTGLWIGDYTIQPENGGMSVFAHEYAHDLGLPDLYSTAGGENSVNFWTLMAQSRVSAPDDEGIGTRSADLGAWEKLQLGWLDYETVLPSQGRSLELGPHEYNSKDAQAAVVVLPKKSKTTELVEPYAGDKSWWSGLGDDLDNSMSREVTLPAGTATLSMQASWDIEDCGPDPCDYAYVEVDDGDGFAAIPGSITTAAEGNGIDGTSDGWQEATFDLSAYAGKTIALRMRYQTDGAAGGKGFFADDITLTAGGEEVLVSGAEDGDEGWTLDGFSAVGSSTTELFDNYYIASHRDYTSFDKYLKSGPYNFGFLNTQPDRVEHFPYQDGLLISYWDTSQPDNNTPTHPGEGLILPIEANPRPIVKLDGQYWRARVAGYDAPFSLEKSDSFTLHTNGDPSYIRGQAAQPLFNDGRAYWYAETPQAGVKVPDHGVNIKVLQQNGSTMKIRVWERP